MPNQDSHHAVLGMSLPLLCPTYSEMCDQMLVSAKKTTGRTGHDP